MEYFGQYDFELSWVQIESMATKSLIIFQGLKAGKTPAKSLPQWGKYKAYNYHKLHNAIHELLSEKRELKREPFTVRKKIKFWLYQTYKTLNSILLKSSLNRVGSQSRSPQ